MRQAHDEAVVAALGYMEREACVVRAGKAGRADTSVGGGFVGGLFAHRTSRALDPQLHTHAVVANFAERAVDARVLYQQARPSWRLRRSRMAGRT